MREPSDSRETIKTFEPVTTKPLYRQVAQQIREAIEAGILEPEAQLPTERELAEMFEVSRSSIREALRFVEAQGLVRGGGQTPPVVAPLRKGSSVSDDMLATLLLHRSSHQDLLEMRVILESGAARLAAKRPLPFFLQRAEHYLKQMDGEITISEFDAINFKFHLAVVASSGNQAIATALELIGEGIRGHLDDDLVGDSNPSQQLARMQDEHVRLLQAVRNGEAELAALLIASHVENAHKYRG